VRRQVGRKQTPKELRELIFQMIAENPTWGAPRIHRESQLDRVLAQFWNTSQLAPSRRNIAAGEKSAK
jgi:hypothetical protein